VVTRVQRVMVVADATADRAELDRTAARGVEIHVVD
jgi:hypothetical protein